MNNTVKNTLRNIVARYGTELSRNPCLCNAYLADLLPNHPVERKHLVEAVAQDLPRKLIQRYTKHEREQLIQAFAKNCQLPAAEASRIAGAWLHALQGGDTAPARVSSSGRSMPVYMGGVVTGLTALVVTSSIAFYQAPSEPLNARAVSGAVAESALIAAPVTAKVPELPSSVTMINPRQPEPRVVALPASVEPPMQLAAANGLGMVNRQQMVMSDTVDASFIGDQNLPDEPVSKPSEKAAIQVPMVVDYPLQWAVAHPRPTMLSTRRDRPEQQKDASIAKAIAIESMQAESKPVAKPVSKPVAKPSPVPRQAGKAAELAQRVEAVEKVVSVPPAPKAQLPPSPVASRAPEAKRELENARRQQALLAYKRQANNLLSGVLQDSMAFGEKVLVLQKKQGDLSAVRELLQLTGDGFYREQQAGVQQQMDGLQKSLDLLSVAYGKKLGSLCSMPIDSKDIVMPAVNGQLGVSARRILEQHWRNCKNISGPSLREQLMLGYGGLRSN